MTLIIGILCEQGVVMAADGAALLAFPGSPVTVRQPVHKLRIIQRKAILGVSGHVGLAQRFESAIDALLKGPALHSPGMACIGAGVETGKALKEHIYPEMRLAQMSVRVVPEGGRGVVSQSLLAIAVKGDPCLIEFDLNGASEVKTPDLWFTSVGTGSPIADPLLAFMRNVYDWKDGRIPTLSQGRFLATWVMKHAILTDPGGVADPRQVAVLAKAPGQRNVWRARILTDDELGEPEQMCEHAEGALRQALGMPPDTEAI